LTIKSKGNKFQKGLIKRIGTFTNELNKFPEELAKVNKVLERQREDWSQGLNEAMKRSDYIEDEVNIIHVFFMLKFQRKLDKMTSKLTEHLKSELGHFEFDIENFKQDLQRMNTTMDEYIVRGNENLSQRIGQISVNLNVLSEKRIEDDNTINSISKLVSQVDNKISQICHYIGIDFDINSKINYFHNL
jgi:methyl-accepting chemotaxis protein